MKAALATLAETLERDHAVRLDVPSVSARRGIAGDASLGQRLVTGDAVNVAARLEQAAESGEVLVGPVTFALVRDLAEVEEVEPLVLKGKSQPVPAYRLLAVRSADASRRRHEGAMVGREAEMTSLFGRVRERGRGPSGRMVTLVGEAGVGKTRLTQEFLDSIAAGARVVRGRCLPYGKGITFWPIVEVVGDAAGISDTDHPELAREEAPPARRRRGGRGPGAPPSGSSMRRSRSRSSSRASAASSRSSPRTGRWRSCLTISTGRSRRSWS